MNQAGADAPAAPARRKLGPWMATALVMGNMIGSGAFLLPVSLAPLGWSSVLGWLVTIGGTLCLAAIFSRLAQWLPGGCGPFTYPAAAFGPGAGFMIAWSYWISVWVTNATLAVATMSSLSILWPWLAATPGAPALGAVAAIWTLTLINCRGMRVAGGVQVLTTMLKILPLAGAILIGGWLLLGFGDAPPPTPAPVTLSGIGAATTLTLFAMLGFESAIAAGDRVENPQRIVPRATLLGTGLTGLIYLLACSAVTLLLPAGDVVGSNSPFALFFATMIDPALGPLVALFAAIAALGALNGFVLLQGELLSTLARSGTFPAWFAAENRRESPVRAHLLSSGAATLLVLANYSRGMADLFVFMVLVTTSVTLIFYAAGMLASFRLARGRNAGAGFAILASMGLIYAVWTFYGAGVEASAWSLLMTLAGAPIYWFTVRALRTA